MLIQQKLIQFKRFVGIILLVLICMSETLFASVNNLTNDDKADPSGYLFFRYPLECGYLEDHSIYVNHVQTSTCYMAIPYDGFSFAYWMREGSFYSTDVTACNAVFNWYNDVALFMNYNTIGDGDTYKTEYLPININYDYSYTQQIFTADEIGGAGNILSIGLNKYQYYNPSRDIVIYMKYTNKSVFNNTHDWIDVTENDIVFDGSKNFLYDWDNVIILDKAFYYDGESNIVFAVCDRSGSHSTTTQRFYGFNTESNKKQSLCVYSNDTNFNPYNPAKYDGLRMSVKNQIRFYKDNQYWGIPFANDVVRELCVDNWNNNDDDELSYSEAAAVTDIGVVFKYNQSISSFDELKYFTSINDIKAEAFSNCSALKSISIPSGVLSIDDEAFFECSNLESITIYADNPPAVGTDVFVNVSKTIPVIVPCGSKTQYLNASGWSEFTNIIEMCSCNITTTVNTEAGGATNGDGLYSGGETCTVSAYANEGFDFVNWTENGVFVSDNPEYTFTVNEDRTLEANFISTQTTQLYSGWNWWSTYIEMDGFNGLEYLENTVGDLGICIKSQVCAVVNYFPAAGESFWFGDDIVIDNENCYMIDVTDDCLVQLDGDKANPADHPIRIKPNWSWIGYIDNVTQSANTAMSDFEPIQEDVIKSKDDAATYWAGYGWYPAINLVPGQGYKYFSNSNEDRYLVYNNASSKSEVAKRQEKFWHYDTHAYANTMTVISVVDIDNEEVAKGNYELAAFVDNECRGSVKLDYFEPLDRYFAVMSIAGNDMEEISFGLADTSNGDVGFNCEQSMTFATDAVVGRLSSPYIISFNHENTDVVVNIYPNPVDKNASFTLDIPSGETISEILIVNSLGAEVLHQTGMTGKVVKGLPVSGIYSIQVITNTGNVYRGKLVVK